MTRRRGRTNNSLWPQRLLGRLAHGDHDFIEKVRDIFIVIVHVGVLEEGAAHGCKQQEVFGAHVGVASMAFACRITSPYCRVTESIDFNPYAETEGCKVLTAPAVLVSYAASARFSDAFIAPFGALIVLQI